MKRRTFLTHAIGVSSLAVLSGCTDDTLDAAESQPPLAEDFYDEELVDLPVRQKFRVVADGIESGSGAEIETVEDFEAYLDEQGIEVESLEEHVEEGEEILALEYVHDQIEQGVASRLGVVAGGYASLVDSEHDSDKLEAEIVTPTDEPFGHYEIASVWAREYNEGEITTREYGHLVLHELESV